MTEQELLTIVETLKYFKHMLLGQTIIIKTDHKNLTHPNSTHTSNQVLCQRLLLEEYGVELEYIKGEKNIVADVLSHLPTEELFITEGGEEFPLNLKLIADRQHGDEQLLQALNAKQPAYKQIVRENIPLCIHPETRNNMHTCLSLCLTLTVVPSHPAAPRYQTHASRPQGKFVLAHRVDKAIEMLVKACNICQKCKRTAVKNMEQSHCLPATALPLGRKYM